MAEVASGSPARCPVAAPDRPLAPQVHGAPWWSCRPPDGREPARPDRAGRGRGAVGPAGRGRRPGGGGRLDRSGRADRRLRLDRPGQPRRGLRRRPRRMARAGGRGGGPHRRRPWGPSVPPRWSVALGPCIHPGCYEFSAPDLDRVTARFGDRVRGRTQDRAPALDLPAAVSAALATAGVRQRAVPGSTPAPAARAGTSRTGPGATPVDRPWSCGRRPTEPGDRADVSAVTGRAGVGGIAARLRRGPPPDRGLRPRPGSRPDRGGDQGIRARGGPGGPGAPG